MLNYIINTDLSDVETLIVSVSEWTVSEWPVVLGLLSRLYLKSLRSLILYCIYSFILS